MSKYNSKHTRILTYELEDFWHCVNCGDTSGTKEYDGHIVCLGCEEELDNRDLPEYIYEQLFIPVFKGKGYTQ
jgi:hypothetical protein